MDNGLLFVYLGHLQSQCSDCHAKNQSKNPRSLNSFEFGMTLVLQLKRPFIELRDRCGLLANIQEKIKFALGKTARDDYDSSLIHLSPKKNAAVKFVWP